MRTTVLGMMNIVVLLRAVFGVMALVLTVYCTSAQAKPYDDITQWLHRLGVSAATAQTDRIVKQELAALVERKELTSESLASINRQLAGRVSDDIVSTSVITFVTNQLADDTYTALEKIAQHPLWIRVRNFDVALEMAGAYNKFASYDTRRLRSPPTEARFALVKRLDKAQRTSEIAALMQTQLHQLVNILAARSSGKQWQDNGSDWVEQQQQHRQRYMSDIVVRLHLFSYRFMKDKELQAYVDLMESDSVQQVLDTAIEGIKHSLSNVQRQIIN